MIGTINRLRSWAAVDLYGMVEEVGIVGAEGLQEATLSKEGRTEKWNEEDETKNKVLLYEPHLFLM